ncbi:NADP-dependent oxidoreductase [Paenibacillus sp. SZ31]|uniref:NADP-dependent oxidoreductase n=1 Tax=Paenibacillus sp. SZ31 TaxID=2725555 RepID=UPI00146ECCFC|nr:NADP-dependent oxidoreductase [Paenibacillus sp. SZ31]NMI03357.1 NADP-dependent oxidoreductase [Paenibacillus sp. SZ31]
MKAAQIAGYSKTLEVEINSIDIPSITSTQVLIKTKAAGVDPHLVLAITGKVKLFDHYDFPLTLGNELAGVVIDVGASVMDFKVGDHVYTMPPLDKMGAFAEYVAVDAAIVAKMPANLSFKEAAAVPLSALTIIQALDILGAQQGSKLFISGGTGGFGQIAIPYAKSQGLFVTVSGSGSARDLANRLGADEFIDYETQDYTHIRRDYDYVIDTRGASEISKHMKLLKPGGTLLALSAGPNARFANRSADLSTGKKILFSLLGLPFDGLAKWHKKSYDFLYVQPNGQQLTVFTQYIEKTNIKPVIDSEYTFDQVNAAIAKIATGHSRGKVLLQVEDGGQ